MTKHADPNDLATFVSQVVGASSLAGLFKGVDVDVGDFGDGSEFIRVLLHFQDLEKISDDDVDTVASSIEGEISKHDDRFPSVRFSDS